MPKRKLSEQSSNFSVGKLRLARIEEINKAKAELQAKLIELDKLEKTNSNRESPNKPMYKNKEFENKEDLDKKKKECAELVKKLSVERKERSQRQCQRQQRLMYELEQKSLLEKSTLQEKFEEEKRRKKAELIQSFTEKRQKRLEEIKKLEEIQKKSVIMPETEYLHKKLEDRFKEEILNPMLEKQKIELAKKRNLIKPITKQEIEEHQRKHEQIMQQKEGERKKQKNERRRQQYLLELQQKKFETVFSRDLHEREEQFKLDQKRKSENKKLARDKMLKYADLIKELHPMQPSERKSLELKNLIDQLKHPVREKRDVKKDYEISKVIPARIVQTSSKEENPYAIKANQRKSSEGKHVRKVKYTTFDQEDSEIRPKVSMERSRPDYLEVFRKKSEYQPVNAILKPQRYNWENDINNDKLDDVERINRVVEKASLIEQRAKMDEKVIRASGNKGNVEMEEHVSDMLIDAIKAKLAVLSKL